MSCSACHRPTSLDEALELAAGSPGARFIAGGTDLLVQMRRRSHAPLELISLRRIDELTRIEAAHRRPANVAVYFSVETRDGEPVADLIASDFNIYYDN